MSNQLQVTIEKSEGYELSDRLQAAIRELDAALTEAHGDDTAGFGKGVEVAMEEVSFVFHNITWTVLDSGPLSRTIVSARDVATGQSSGRRQYEP